jgi:hypothetical protein
MSKPSLASLVIGGSLAALVGCGLQDDQQALSEASSAALEADRDVFGVAESFHTAGAIDFTNPFFQPLGSNARDCSTCHAADMGWTMATREVRQLFRDTDGLAPLFLPHDEGTRPDADLSTPEAREAAFGSTTVALGVTRFGRTVPATSQFSVIAVEDPAGFATPTSLTNFRRPTPTANEAKTSSILWTSGPQPDIFVALKGLMAGASNFHLQRDPTMPVPVEQQEAGANFLLGLFFAQSRDNWAGPLDAAGAKGGPANLAAQPFALGANDLQSATFTRKVFDLYDAWAVHADHLSGRSLAELFRNVGRASIYRGQKLFNEYEFDITGVAGLNDLLGQDTVRGTCSTCHNVPNVGGHAVFRTFDLGTADEPSCNGALPILTLQNRTTMETRRVCDMGRGANGVWADVGKFRVPPLRGLAARAPYFHDGQARTIGAVIRYYQKRFNLGLTWQQRHDLESFLGAL